MDYSGHLPQCDEALLLHQRIMLRSHSLDVSALTASIACRLMRKDHSKIFVLISWWIALKFEEIYQPHISDLLRDYNINSTYRNACEVERQILLSIDFKIPHNGVIREMYSTKTSLSNIELRDWSYVLLYSNLYSLHSGLAWVRLIESQGSSNSALSLALSMCHRLIARNLTFRPLSLTSLDLQSPQTSCSRKRKST